MACLMTGIYWSPCWRWQEWMAGMIGDGSITGTFCWSPYQWWQLQPLGIKLECWDPTASFYIARGIVLQTQIFIDPITNCKGSSDALKLNLFQMVIKSFKMEQPLCKHIQKGYCKFGEAYRLTDIMNKGKFFMKIINDPKKNCVSHWRRK